MGWWEGNRDRVVRRGVRRCWTGTAVAASGTAGCWAGWVAGTTEHLVPRVKGGPCWLENESAACGRCNRERGHRSPAEWAGECERRGWPVDRERLLAGLLSLQTAIGSRGGQRRARRYLASQLRRLAQADPSTGHRRDQRVGP